MTTPVKTFADFDIDAPIHEALSELGIITPFPIQELTLPLALSGADLIGQARTGTGKTLAFGIPMLERIDTDNDDTQALVIVPTRELCLQVHDDLKAAGAKKGVSVVAAYGGRAIDPQSEAIAGGAELVVGTPGRLLDLMRRGKLQLSTVTTLVLDEADEMLDMGFLPDVEQLIEGCADQRQTLLFSATMPSEVVGLARRYMRKPTFMRADVEESRVAPETQQHFFAVHRMDKPALVARILATPERGRCVIFTRTKRMADMLVKDLREADLNAAAIHSDLRQEAREKTLARFRSGKVDVMCATEVAARGLDIDEVTHVINYDCPDDEKMYLHRIGRTGRAGADGVAVTLAIWSELARLDMIKKALDITEPTLEVFSTSSELDELFPLPEADEGSANGQATAGTQKKKATSKGGGRREDGKGDGRRSGGRSGDRGGRSSGATGTKDRPARGDDAGGSTPTTGDEDTGRRRVRRRGRSTAGAERADTAGAERTDTSSSDAAATGAAATDADSGTGDTAVVRRRVRQRSTSTPRTAAKQSGSASDAKAGDTTSDPDAKDSSTVGADSPTGGSVTDSKSSSTDNAPTETSQRSEAAGARGNRGRRGGRRRGGGQTRQSGSPRGRTNAADDDRGRSSGSGRTDRDTDEQPDAAAARGDGQPALRRPLVVSHLP